MDGGHEVDQGAGAAVQSHGDTGELGVVGDLAHAGDAASVCRIRMDDIEDTVVQEWAKAVDHFYFFASEYGHGRCALKLGPALGVLDVEGVFNPSGMGG